MVVAEPASSLSRISKSPALDLAGIAGPLGARNTGKGTSPRLRGAAAALRPRNPASMYCATRSLNFTPLWTARVLASRKSGSGRSIVVLTPMFSHFTAFLSKCFFASTGIARVSRPKRGTRQPWSGRRKHGCLNLCRDRDRMDPDFDPIRDRPMGNQTAMVRRPKTWVSESLFARSYTCQVML